MSIFHPQLILIENGTVYVYREKDKEKAVNNLSQKLSPLVLFSVSGCW